MYDIVLLSGSKSCVTRANVAWALSGIIVVGYGTTAPSLFAMAANRYFFHLCIDKRALAKVAMKNHHNAP